MCLHFYYNVFLRFYKKKRKKKDVNGHCNSEKKIKNHTKKNINMDDNNGNGNNKGTGNNELPQVVYLTNEEEAVNLVWFQNVPKYITTDSRIKVATIEGINEQGALVPKDATVGDVLILNPYEEATYLQAEDTQRNDNKVVKLLKLTEIFQKLGASSYKINYGVKSKKEREFDEKVGVKYKIVNGEESVKLKTEEMKQMGIEIDGEFAGNKVVSEKSYREAQALAFRYKLLDNQYVKSLINKRAPGQEHPMEREHIKIELMEDYNKRLDVAAKLDVAGGIFKLKADVKNAVKINETITLDIEVSFPK